MRSRGCSETTGRPARSRRSCVRSSASRRPRRRPTTRARRASTPGAASSRSWRKAPGGARVRGPPLGRRGSTRLHRPSGRLGRRHPVVVRLHGQARALRSSSGLGRRQTKRFDDLAFSAFGRGDRKAAHGAARAHVLPAEQQAALLRRAGGNPLYAEQFARMLVERGDADELPIPETVQGIIAARLDGLDREEKALLQDAAVVGKVFWSGPLTQMNGRNRSGVEHMLHALTRKEFVRGQRRSSVEGESEYAFLHLLVPDVAYSQIPRAARLAKHRAVAGGWPRWGEPRTTRRSLPITISRRSTMRRAVGAVDPALEESARHALRSAGDRALALNAFSSAARFYQRALDLWPRDDPERAYVLFGLGVARYWAEAATTELEEARDELHEARELGEGSRGRSNGRVRRLQTTESSLARLQQAYELVRERPLSRSKAFVLAQLAYRAASVRDPGWEQYAQEALAMAEGLGAEDIRALVLTAIGTATAGEESSRSSRRSRSQTRSARSKASEPGSISLLGSSRRASCSAASRCRRRARSDARRFGLRDGLRHLRSELVLESYWRGRWDESTEEADAFSTKSTAVSPHPVGEMFCRSMRAQIRLARGDTADAIADGEKAVDVAREWTVWGFLVVPLAGLARILAGRRQDRGGGRARDRGGWDGTARCDVCRAGSRHRPRGARSTR